MNRYEIRCTADQTKKALELGAPTEIYDTFDSYDIKETNIFYKDKFIELPDGRLIEYITAEEMIGFLEEQDCFNDIVIEKFECHWHWLIYGEHSMNSEDVNYQSRKEATLAAIDAALDYLLTRKQQAQ